MDILKLINEEINNQATLKKLGKSVGADTSKVKQLTQLGLPTLLQALENNASTSEGAEALAGALDDHQDDNVDNLEEFFNNVNSDDGAKILQHIFAGKNDTVKNNLAKQTGLKKSQVSGLMTQLAPMLLGALGQQKKEQELDASGVAGLLSGLTAQSGKNGLMDMVTNLLDSDKDGSIVDEVGGLFKRLFKKK